MYCVNCGRELSEDSKFCSYCGNPLGKVFKSGEKINNKGEKTKQATKYVWGVVLLAFIIGIIVLIANIHTCDWCHETYIGAQYYDWDDPESLMCEDCARDYYDILPYKNYKK